MRIKAPIGEIALFHCRADVTNASRLRHFDVGQKGNRSVRHSPFIVKVLLLSATRDPAATMIEVCRSGGEADSATPVKLLTGEKTRLASEPCQDCLGN